jgi:hypothetical protein
LWLNKRIYFSFSLHSIYLKLLSCLCFFKHFFIVVLRFGTGQFRLWELALNSFYIADFSYSVNALWFSYSQRFCIILVFQSFEYERSWRRFFQKHVVCSKLERNESGRFGALKSDSTHHFFRNVRVITVWCFRNNGHWAKLVV